MYPSPPPPGGGSCYEHPPVHGREQAAAEDVVLCTVNSVDYDPIWSSSLPHCLKMRRLIAHTTSGSGYN